MRFAATENGSDLFRKVFSDPPEAAGLLRPNLPAWLSTRLDWSTLTLLDRSYVDEELDASQSDLLFEHQSTPNRWLSFRLLE